MSSSAKLMGLIVVGVAIYFILNSNGTPTSAGANTIPIDAAAGYVLSDIDKGEAIPAEDGVLEGIVPMAAFAVSGRVYKLEKDNQDGFSHSVTVVFGKLASSDVFKYLLDDGAMNKQFDDGFVLNSQYFRSHVAAFYVHSATGNLEKAMNALHIGMPVRLKGDLVYLKTKDGLIKTSLDPAEFKCKYIYLKEMATDESVYY